MKRPQSLLPASLFLRWWDEGVRYLSLVLSFHNEVGVAKIVATGILLKLADSTGHQLRKGEDGEEQGSLREIFSEDCLQLVQTGTSE